MAFKFIVVCAAVLLVQDAAGSKVVYGTGGSSAAAASAAAASVAAARGGEANKAAASTAAAASAASTSSTGGALLGLTDYDIIYSEPLLVTSTSGFYPTGLSVSSDIGLQGPLYVNGRLPFLSAVGFEGSLATDGSGVSTCGCGSDNIGIIQEV